MREKARSPEEKIEATTEALGHGAVLIRVFKSCLNFDANTDKDLVPLTLDRRIGNDLTMDEEGMRGTMMFFGKEHYCDIPWEAVFSVTCSRGHACDMFTLKGLVFISGRNPTN